MSDTKNPKLSEIRARVQSAAEKWAETRSVITPPLGDIPYLLDLVGWMGKALGTYADQCKNLGKCEMCEEARELLKEIEK